MKSRTDGVVHMPGLSASILDKRCRKDQLPNLQDPV